MDDTCIDNFLTSYMYLLAASFQSHDIAGIPVLPCIFKGLYMYMYLGAVIFYACRWWVHVHVAFSVCLVIESYIEAHYLKTWSVSFEYLYDIVLQVG